MNRVVNSPKHLFILDGLGALTSALLLGLVLPHFEIYTGIPAATCYLLACIPLFFVGYDVVAYRRTTHTSMLLRGIASLNLSYCALSFAAMLHHQSSLTLLGATYILLEISIIALLIFAEYRTSISLQKPK